MKICVLVKEVPDAAVEKRINPSTGRMDRSGEKNLNPFDTHAIEAAMQLKEGGAIEVEEVVAVTMGPESAKRALTKAVSLGADRSLHLSDEALAGSDVNGTGYALAKALEGESPDLVLLGQQSDDGECYTIGAVVADSGPIVTATISSICSSPPSLSRIAASMACVSKGLSRVSPPRSRRPVAGLMRFVTPASGTLLTRTQIFTAFQASCGGTEVRFCRVD